MPDLTVDAPDPVIVPAARRVEAFEPDLLAEGRGPRIVPQAEEGLSHLLDDGRRHARMRDDGQIRIPARREDFPEVDLLPRLIVPEEAGVDGAPVDAPGLELGEDSFLIARKHLRERDAGLAQGHHRDRVGDEA